MSEAVVILRPDWDVAGVNAGFTLRTGGVSAPPYDSLNLALHVGDDPGRVRDNRRRFVEAAGLAKAPRWLSQVHGNRVAHIGDVDGDVTEADAVWSDRPDEPCAVLIADCLPVLIAAGDGCCVAAVHAGWRGLASGIIKNTIAALPCSASTLTACVGPGITAPVFQVGLEVVAAFREAGVEPVGTCDGATAWLDLHATAAQLLRECGVASVVDYSICTFNDPAGFYSYRRDRTTGRFAGFIALSP